MAASDITVAAIATGRLYVVGNTERPHTPVTLDGQFKTESDDNGKFQYELVYYPSRCIVSATIEGKTYDAVVSDCGQRAEQCQLDRTKGSPSPAAPPPPSPAKPSTAAAGPAGTPAVAPTTTPAAVGREAAVQPPPVAAASNPEATSAVNVKARPAGDGLPGAISITNPPLPPPRPVFRTQARAQPVEVPRRPVPTVRRPPPPLDEPEPVPED